MWDWRHPSPDASLSQLCCHLQVILPVLSAAGLRQQQSTSSLCRGPQGSHGLVFP